MRWFTALVLLPAFAAPAQAKTPLARAADKICVHYSQEGKHLGSPDLTKPKVAARYFRAAGELAHAQLLELRALTASPAQADDFRHLLRGYGRGNRLLHKLARAAAANDKQRGAHLINRLTPISEQVDTAARAIGARRCASS